jgi:hypothetical protein
VERSGRRKSPTLRAFQTRVRRAAICIRDLARGDPGAAHRAIDELFEKRYGQDLPRDLNHPGVKLRNFLHAIAEAASR